METIEFAVHACLSMQRPADGEQLADALPRAKLNFDRFDQFISVDHKVPAAYAIPIRPTIS